MVKSESKSDISSPLYWGGATGNFTFAGPFISSVDPFLIPIFPFQLHISLNLEENSFMMTELLMIKTKKVFNF